MTVCGALRVLARVKTFVGFAAVSFEMNALVDATADKSCHTKALPQQGSRV